MYKEDFALNPTQPNQIYSSYMYKEDFPLNNLQWSICYETQPNQQTNLSIH